MKVTNHGSQKVEADMKMSASKAPKVITGKDLRAGKK